MTRFKIGLEEFYFVIVSFKTGKAKFNGLMYKPNINIRSIKNPFNRKEMFREKDILTFTIYDLILFYPWELIQRGMRIT